LGTSRFAGKLVGVDEARYARLYGALALCDFVDFDLAVVRNVSTLERLVLSASISRFRRECLLPVGSGRPLKGPSAQGVGYVLTNWQSWIAALPERGGAT